MPHGPITNIRLGDFLHSDGRLHSHRHTQLLKRIDPSLQPVHIHLNNASISLVERCDGALRVVDYNMDAAYLNGADGEDE